MQSAQFACAHQMGFIIQFNLVRAVKVFVRHLNPKIVISIALYLNEQDKGFFRRSVLNKVEYICRLGQNSCDLTSGTDRQRCQKCRLTACFKAGMRENFIRKRKNRTKTRRTLENMKRPSVIISPFTCEQVHTLFDSLTLIEKFLKRL